MTPYFICLFSILILAGIEQFTHKYAHSGLVLVRLFLFIALNLCFSSLISRGDYCNYDSIFYDILADKSVSVEPTYILLSKLFGYIWNNSFSIFFFYGFLSFLLKFKALQVIEKNIGFINYSFYFSIYVGLFVMQLEGGAMRFAVAQSFILLASTYLVFYNAYKKFFLLTIIASFFHISALSAVLLPIFWLSSYQKNIFYIVLAILFGLVFNYLILDIMAKFAYISPYIGKFYAYTRFGSVHLNVQMIRDFFVLIAFTVIFFNQLQHKNKKIIYLIWITLLYGLFLVVISYSNHLTASRFITFYTFLEPIAILYIIIKFKISDRFFLIGLLIIILSINYGASLNNQSINNPNVLPYKNYILGDEIDCNKSTKEVK